MSSILIGTSGFLHNQWFDNNIFYPNSVGTTAVERLRYYSSRFNMLTISSTYEANPDSSIYEEWTDAVASKKKGFSFVVTAPKKFTDSHSVAASINEWGRFWNGYFVRRNCSETIKKGGCKILHEKGVLGCILLQFSAGFHFSPTHVNKILKITKLAPKDVRFSFLFHHCSWRENRERVLEIFQRRENWCITTPFVENRLVDFGWAGNIPSTRTKDVKQNPSILLTTNFIHICLSGTLGPQLGSYDKNGFLERFAVELEKLKSMGVTIFCSFDATTAGTTFCYPLPGMIISGFFLNPKLEELPSHTSIDRPCCLHDAMRLQEILASQKIQEPRLGVENTKRYRRGEDGFVDIKFTSN